jgi:NAD(P)-dependent dehydrogenase (short-subunit alcohol dehydrogenase family)
MPKQQQDRQPGREHEMSPAPDFMPRFRGSARLEGKVALIGGGDSGIGRAVAALFAREGADLAILYKDEEQDARETEEHVVAEGRRCLLFAGDVGEEEVCRDAVEQTVATFGRLDILINNAAEQHPRDDPIEITSEQLERTFRTNAFGCFHMVKAALPHLESGAAIINTTSVTAYRGSHHLIDYAATKGAIVAFTRSLSSALVDRGIRVNAVAPGPIWTPLIPASFEAEKVEHFGENVPMGRPGQPNEVASCHLFLACDDSSYMTGQVLHPNGGELIGG